MHMLNMWLVVWLAMLMGMDHGQVGGRVIGEKTLSHIENTMSSNRDCPANIYLKFGRELLSCSNFSIA